MQNIPKITIDVFYLCFHAYSQSLNANWQHGTTYALNLNARSMPVSTVSTPVQLPFSAHFKRCELDEENPHHSDLKSSNISKKSKLLLRSEKEVRAVNVFLHPSAFLLKWTVGRNFLPSFQMTFVKSDVSHCILIICPTPEKLPFQLTKFS